VVVGGDVGREELRLPGLVLRRFIASTTSGMTFFIGAKTWFPCGSSFLMKSPPSQNWYAALANGSGRRPSLGLMIVPAM